MATNASFNHETTATHVADVYSSRCAGKTVLITGVSPGGIGDATAHAFGRGGAATVIITGRNDTKLSKMIETLSSAHPKTTFRSLNFDMESLTAVNKAAQELLADASIPTIDIVVCNAGLSTFQTVRITTEDGIEKHFGANHLSHFLLVSSLLPKLQAAARKNAPGETRVVMMSSQSANYSPIRFHDWNYENKPVPPEEAPAWAVPSRWIGREKPEPFEFTIAYAQSKTANALVAHEINRRFAKEGIYGFAIDPGFVNSHGAQAFVGATQKDQYETYGFLKNLDQGAATTVVAALDPALKPESGMFLADCQVRMDMCPDWAADDEAAERLWKLSEDIVKEKLGQ